MRKNLAIFLDRDGVLNVEKSYIVSESQLEIFDYTADAVLRLKNLGYKCICITNQSAVARGMMTEAELSSINKKLIDEAQLDALYYCPHYPPEDCEIQPYNVLCNCRKPEAGMILAAAKDHDINLEESYFVGDRYTDIMAAKKAGTISVFVGTSCDSAPGNEVISPDYTFPTLLEFVVFLENTKVLSK